MHTRSLPNSFVQGGAAPRTWAGGVLQPGFGTSELHVGQSSGDVEISLGPPDEKVRSGNQCFHVYRSRGVDVDFGRGQQVEALFFFAANIERHWQAAPVHLNGIRWGSTRTQVVKVLGKPDTEGGPVRVGNRKKSWISYNSGIEFDFDSRNRVILMIVFNLRLPTRS